MAPPPTPRRVVVQPLQELRIELEAGEAVSVKLLNGSAEIFGHELAQGLDWPLTDEVRAAIFTWTGCELEISRLSVHRRDRQQVVGARSRSDGIAMR